MIFRIDSNNKVLEQLNNKIAITDLTDRRNRGNIQKCFSLFSNNTIVSLKEKSADVEITATATKLIKNYVKMFEASD